MMEFFEFFFSGPGWGWKVVALIFLISPIFDFLAKAVKQIFDYKLNKFRIVAEEAAKRKAENKDEGTPATADDVRS